MRCQWGLQSPKFPGTQESFGSLLWLVVSGSRRRAEGGHNSQRKEHIAILCVLIAGEQCYSTPPTAWACGLVAQSVPTHAIWLACFLLFFNIDFTMSNLTVSLPVLEWHLHVAFIVAFCNLKTVFLSPMTLASLGRKLQRSFWCPELLPQASSCLFCLSRQSNTNVGLKSAFYALGTHL